jgi:hypothetical protein
MKTHTLPTSRELKITRNDWVSETWALPLQPDLIHTTRLRTRTLRPARLGLVLFPVRAGLRGIASSRRAAAVTAGRFA